MGCLWCSTVGEFLGINLLARLECGEWTQKQYQRMFALQSDMKDAIRHGRTIGSADPSQLPRTNLAKITSSEASRHNVTCHSSGRYIQQTVPDSETTDAAPLLRAFSGRVRRSLGRLGLKTREQLSALTLEGTELASLQKDHRREVWMEVQAFLKHDDEEDHPRHTAAPIKTDTGLHAVRGNLLPGIRRDEGRQNKHIDSDMPLNRDAFGVRAWHCLQRLGITTWGQFSTIQREDVLGTRSAGIGTWNEILALQCRMSVDIPPDRTNAAEDPCRLENLKATLNPSDHDSRHPHQPDTRVKVHEDEPFEIERFSVRTRHCLEALGVCEQDQLNRLTRQQVLSVPNAGSKTWLEICSLQACTSHSILEESSLDYSGLDRLAKSYLHAILKNARHERVVWARWNVDASTRPPTLDVLGHELGLTKERVRQILEKSEQKLRRCSSSLNPLWQRILDFTGPQCVISSLPDLSEYLYKSFRWQERPDVHRLRKIVSLRSDFRVAEGANGRCIDVLKQDYIVASLAKALIHIARDNATQQDAADLWSIDFESLRELLGKQCYLLLAETGLPSFPEYLVDLALSEVSRSVRREGSRVYSANLWSLRFGNHLELVETILLREARVMHFKEVLKESLLWRPTKELSQRNIHACLDRSPNAILWSRGSFIHRDHISVPYKIIRRAETWLLKHLSKDAPLYSAHGLYKRFASELSAAGISSEIALYSCLRLSAHPDLSCPRYPYILLTGNTRLPVTLLLEEYLQQAERPISLEELRAFACETMGIDEVQFNLKLPDVPNVIRVDRASYLHTDSLDIDMNSFDELCKYLHDLLRRHRHVSIMRVFEDRQVTCRKLTIKSPEMLYSLLSVFSGEDFDASHYPQVTLRGTSDGPKAVAGVTQAVLDFLKELKRPCSYAELEDHFITERGYRLQTIYCIAQNADVFAYAHGCIVHQEVLCLSQDVQRHVERISYAAFVQEELRGGIYVLVDDILESFELPPLAHGITWTPTLLADVLSRSTDFRVIGSAKQVIVSIPNKRGIVTLEDLIGLLVQEEYCGIVQLQAIEQQLRIRQIIKKRLTERMIGSGSKVRIVDGEVVALETAQC